jgi:UDPglucose--hexose-1-phosphate uridylyltransferase
MMCPMSIEFEKTVKYAKILSPLKNFEEDTVTFEYRTDPLTGRNTTVIRGMLNYVSRFLTSDAELLNSLVEKTKANCPFCPESVRTKTPMFPREFLAEGRIFVGDAVVVPNLLGHAEQSVLAILSRAHHLKLKDFTPKMLFDGFRGGVEYLKRLSEVDASVRFPVFVFNYLTPAGSSIFHPHMQILARDRPFHLVKLLLSKSRAYHEKHGSSYWHDLAVKEKNAERYLFEINDAEWLVPFAPLRGLNEAQAIVNGKSHLKELSNSEWLGLAKGISKILKFYHFQGYTSFNIIIMSGPLDKHLDYFDVNLRIMSRPGIQQFCFTDAWAVPYLLWDGEAVEEPEHFAERAKAFFKET